MANHNRYRCLHRPSPLPFQEAARNEKCFATLCSWNGQIFKERTVNSAIELGQVGGCEHVGAEVD